MGGGRAHLGLPRAAANNQLKASSHSIKIPYDIFMNLKAKSIFIAAILLTFSSAGLEAAQSPAPKDAKAYIISPKNGDKVKSPVVIQFGLEGMGVAPAGMKKANTGHHHLLIDLEKLPNLKIPLPTNEHVVHFGGGQTQVTKELAPGKHTLQIILGDATHIPHNPPIMSEKITIEVVE